MSTWQSAILAAARRVGESERAAGAPLKKYEVTCAELVTMTAEMTPLSPLNDNVTFALKPFVPLPAAFAKMLARKNGQNTTMAPPHIIRRQNMD